MSIPSLPTRDRLIQAALELFLSQGISNTTTRQIANLAEVNEVTLFRHFRNKYGLILAVVEESPTFATLGESLVQGLQYQGDVHQYLKDYTKECLRSLNRSPEFLRSLIGEADQYPEDNHRALSQRLSEINRTVAQAFAKTFEQHAQSLHLPPDTLVELLNAALLGYAVIELTCKPHDLWSNQDEFVEKLLHLVIGGAIAPTVSDAFSPSVLPQLPDAPAGPAPVSAQTPVRMVLDLPSPLVHAILQEARKAGLQDHALAYVLFGAGVSPSEISGLQRSHQVHDSHQHILQITSAKGIRQIPVNQWILGKRYGSYTNNPLTKWLKSRKDDSSAMFLNNAGQSISDLDIQQRWHGWVGDLLTLEGNTPAIAQAQQTWCVEMLMRGMSLENLSILTGWDMDALQPYAHRAKEKVALEQATQLDRKPRSASNS